MNIVMADSCVLHRKCGKRLHVFSPVLCMCCDVHSNRKFAPRLEFGNKFMLYFFSDVTRFSFTFETFDLSQLALPYISRG